MSDNPTQTNSGGVEGRSGSHNPREDEVKKLTSEFNEIKELLLKVLLDKEQDSLRSDSQVPRDARVSPRLVSQHGIGASQREAPRLLVPQTRRHEDTSSLGGRSDHFSDPMEERSTISKSGRKRVEGTKSDSVKVFKFDGTDYEIWAKAMGFYLEVAGVWDVVVGLDPRPDDPEEFVEWKVLNTKACNIIFNALTRDQQKNVVICEEAAEMWRTLSEIYARKSMVNQAHLIQEYEDFHMKRGVTMQRYISELKSYVGRLRGIGVVYPEKSIVLKLLRGLSEEYAVDRKILYNTENLGFEDVCGRLLSEAVMVGQHKKFGGNVGPALANTTMGSNKSFGPEKRRCYVCGEAGHISPKCPLKQSVGGSAKVYKCYSCGELSHKIADCPKHKEELVRGSKKSGGKANLVEGKDGKASSSN
jgi:hypothetical protein